MNENNQYFEAAINNVSETKNIIENYLFQKSGLKKIRKDMEGMFSGIMCLNDVKSYTEKLPSDLFKKYQITCERSPYAENINIRMIRTYSIEEVLENEENKDSWLLKSLTLSQEEKLTTETVKYNKEVLLNNEKFIMILTIDINKKRIHLEINRDKYVKYNVLLFHKDMFNKPYKLLELNDMFFDQMKPNTKSLVMNEINSVLFLLMQKDKQLVDALLEHCFSGQTLNISKDLAEQYELLYDEKMNISTQLFSGIMQNSLIKENKPKSKISI